MSWLCDDAEVIADSWLTSAYAGHGVLAENIPATGEHGPSVLYDQVALPADAGKEISALGLTAPSGLTSWHQDEDGTVTAEGPDGAYSYTIQVYVDGVALGSPKTVTLTFGAASVSAAVTGSAGALAASAQSPVTVGAAITGSAGTLSASAGTGTIVSAAITGSPGTLAAVAGVQASASAAVTGSAGTLAASASGTVTFTAAAAHCLARPPAESRIVRPPLETLIVRPRA